MADKYLEKQAKQRQKERDKFEKDRAKWKKQEARKRSKKTRKVDAGPVIFKIVAIVVSAAFVLGLAAMYAASFGFPARLMPAVSAAGSTVYEPEWAFYYFNQYRQHYDMALTYAPYKALGMDYGLDTEKSIFGQPVPEGQDIEEATWDEFLRTQTNKFLQAINAQCAEAKQAGVELSEEDIQELDDEFEELKFTANTFQVPVSVTAYLRMMGNPAGVTERVYRKLLERQKLAAAYEEAKSIELRANYSDEALQAEYEADRAYYDFVDFRAYPFAKEVLSAEDGESDEDFEARKAVDLAETKAEAEAFLAKATSEAAFIAAANERNGEDENYDAQTATLNLRKRASDLNITYFMVTKEAEGEDEEDERDLLSDWAFAEGRKAGDVTLFETVGNFYVVMVARPGYAINSVNYYTINVGAQESFAAEEEEDAEARAMAQAKETADEILSKWEEAGTLAEFQALAIEHAASPEDTAATEYAKPGMAGDAALDNWLFAQERRTGQATVLENANGYTVVYLAEQNQNDPTWKDEIADDHVDEDYEAYMTELLEKYPLKQRKVGLWFGMRTAKQMCDSYQMMKMMEAAQGAGAGYDGLF